jgi:hypothetical protein
MHLMPNFILVPKLHPLVHAFEITYVHADGRFLH